MKEQRIIVEIDPEGGMTADAEGFTGDLCLKDLERLLDGLDAGAAEVTRKAPDGSAKVSPRASSKLTAGKKS